MKKLSAILAFCICLISGASAHANKIDLDSIVQNSALNRTSTIAVSVKNAKTGDVEYEYNQDKLLHPASVLKVITLPAALNTLGTDYTYETKFGIDDKNNLYIKLGADPQLNGEQLKTAVQAIPAKELNKVVIDDKVLDRYEWGIGWMWDDETNPLMAKISPYNFKENLLNVKIIPANESGSQAKVYPEAIGAASIVNLVTTGNKNDILVYRQNSISPNIVYVYGTAASEQTVKIPIGNPERNFITNLEYHMKNRNIAYPNSTIGIYPETAKTFFTVKNDIKPIIPKILQDSSNYYAETLFKTAGGINAKAQGCFENSQKLFNEYYKSLGVDTKKIILADASGVSRNNLFSADWITEALYKIQKDKNFEYIKANMANPGKGTMQNRLMDLDGKLEAKTGSLSNISAIAGYVKDDKGEEHVFSIMVENFNSHMKEARDLQDKIIRAIYK